MAKLVVIGIDGMDPHVFEKIQSEMPFISSILKPGDYKPCQSVFPPDSIPAWVTIFTGEYPEKHGWLDNIDYEDIRKGAEVSQLCALQGRTFWDQIGRAGKRVCIINPLLAYPVWPVNGIMVNGPVFISGEKQIFPEELIHKYELPELGGMTDFPAQNKLEQFLEVSLQSTQDLAQFGLDLFDLEPWDLFFISFFTLDRLQHFLWRFWDKADPLYPGNSNLENAIIRAYQTFDEIVGQFLERLDDSTGLVVISDHGHGQRPTMLLNLNEALRQDGFLKIDQGKNNFISPKKIVEIAKNISIKFVVNILGERWLYHIGRLLPKKTRKALKKSDYLIDKKKSVAWVSELGGGASVGGIVINPQFDKSSQEYKSATAQIAENIEKITQGANGSVVRWTKVSKENSLYPDIIFELDPRFSVGRSLFCPIVEKNPRHRIISGGHKKEGVLFTHHCGEVALNINSVSDISQEIISFVLSP